MYVCCQFNSSQVNSKETAQDRSTFCFCTCVNFVHGIRDLQFNIEMEAQILKVYVIWFVLKCTKTPMKFFWPTHYFSGTTLGLR